MTPTADERPNNKNDRRPRLTDPEQHREEPPVEDKAGKRGGGALLGQDGGAQPA